MVADANGNVHGAEVNDAQGLMWYGSPSNNKVGYFYLTNKPGSEEHISKGN